MSQNLPWESLKAWLRALPRSARPEEVARAKAEGWDPDQDPRHRKIFPVHLTASTFAFDPSFERVLLIRHKALGKWLQPGGHVDPGEAPWEAALRECEEETGLTGEVLSLADPDPEFLGSPWPFDVDLHPIPARPEKDEPAHLHLDLRFLVVLEDPDGAERDPSEIDQLGWFRLEDPDLQVSPQLVQLLSKAQNELRTGRGKIGKSLR